MRMNLILVVLEDCGVVCHKCVGKHFGEAGIPDSATPVYETDDWKYEAGGICVECGNFVSGDASA